MTPRALRGWSWVHKWTSLVATLFMLILCVTGLPLVFYEEIDHLAGSKIEAPAMPAGTPRASLDAVVAAAVAAFPGKVPLYVFAEKEDPGLWLVKLDTRVDTDERNAVFAAIDARTARWLGQPVFNDGVMNVFYRLHVDLFAAEAGRLFLGAMGLLLVISIVSGTVLYAPFMRRLLFGTVRHDRSPQLRWLDLHNLLGIGTLVWALAVAATGVVNTGAGLLLSHWQRTEVAERLAAYRGQPPVPEDQRAPLQAVLAAAQAQAPGRRLAFAAFPGTAYSSPYHVTCYLNGDDPLASRLPRPVLVDARTAAVTASLELPWYLKVALLARPLHVAGDGALPLKLLWALLDMATIVVLGSGLYLWLGRRTGLPQEPAPRGRSG